MPKITQQMAIQAALIARGSELVPSSGRRYKVLTRPGEVSQSGKKPDRYYVGKAGALRIGPSASHSVPALSSFITTLLREGGYEH